MSTAPIHLLLNGVAPTLAVLQMLVLHSYGHYTSFIAQDNAVRGWSLHQQRLQRDAEALLGARLDLSILSAQLRAALARAAAPQSVRISVHARQPDLRRLGASMLTDVLIRSSPWQAAEAAPLRLQSSCGLREAAQHKHLGLSGALLARRQAQMAGADDALLLDAQGQVAEGPTWSLGVYDGHKLRWPTAPALPGITAALLRGALAARGLQSEHAALRVGDLVQARAVFACNARQACMPISAIDGQALRRDPDFEALVQGAWLDVPFEPV